MGDVKTVKKNSSRVLVFENVNGGNWEREIVLKRRVGQGGDPKRLMQKWGRRLKKVESMRTKNVKQKWKERSS